MLWRVLAIAGAVLVMLHVCPKAAGLTWTVNMEPPSSVLSTNPSTTLRRYNLMQGATFNISCNVTHDDCSFTVDMYKDGTALPVGNFMDVELKKPRSTNCTMAEIQLVFQNFQAKHDGNYYCYASTNDGSQVLSDEGYLYGSETPPPMPVRVTPKHTVFYEDESIELEARFRGNFYESHWLWRMTVDSTNVVTLNTSIVTAVNVTNLGQTYSIAVGTMHHRTGYYVPALLQNPSASLTGATADITAVVNEHVPPAVTFVGLQPSYQLGSTVTLTCTATGFPEVSIEFEVSGVSATVTKQTQTQASLHPPFTVSKVLTLERVTTSDCGGRISCTGTNMNRVGTHTSKVESTVQIRAAPVVTTDPPTPAATIGSQLTLKCSADDCLDEGFAFRWMLNGQQVDSSRVTSIGNNVSQLTVDSVGTADIGTYTCWVTNAVGTTTGTFTVMEADASNIVQIHLYTPASCPTWVAINTEAKLDDVKSGITMLLQARCSCAVQVLGGQFTCVDGSTVAYQADLHYRLPSDSAQPSAVGVLSAWVLENPAIPTEGILLRVNPSCRVQVTSFEDTACFPTTTDTSLSREAIIGIVIGVILAIVAVLGLVGIIIVLMLCYRKKVKDYAHLAAEKRQRTRVAMQSNFEMRRSIDMRPKPDDKRQPTANTAKLVNAMSQQRQSRK